ncbi:FkbM family methyltransferase [Methylobacter psychrophilus]|uniref:FkbM family methyltransferase n=1 Tax=Methylobacter psychrophilus TaxID=96941 RepID=UPI0021D493F7|nr:FkbM family methyltransferase [Methylobacter psychrophilus]
MTNLISYAQNFEDVMLWRALSHVDQGFYIDIGANDPVIDSVSLAFHEHGWRGIHVEPTPHYAELLRQQRPNDTVIQAAIGNGPAVLQFFEIPETGISTADPAIAQQHRERGFDVHEITVPCIKLSAVFKSCAEPEIHWLKIDVEGFEKQVLSSWGKSTPRPWIVVVESTLPLTQIETHKTWESILIGKGYSPVYFDGLNRYYLSDRHPELKNAFLAPPNVFDDFTLNGTANSSFHQLIDQRYKQKINEILAQNKQEKLFADNEVERLTLNLDSLNKSRTEREQLLSEQTRLARQELENFLRALAQREQEVATQLLAIQQQATQEKSEQAHHHREQERARQQEFTEREQALTRQLQTVQLELRRLEHEWSHREKEHVEQTSQAQKELESLLRTMVQREQDVAAQLLSIQQQATQEQAELTQNHNVQVLALQHEHTEREQTFTQQLQIAQLELRRLEQEWSQREKIHAEQTSQSQKELENILRTLVQREQDVAAQLLAIQQQATQEQAELAQSHNVQMLALQDKYTKREQTFTQQLQAAQLEFQRLEQEWSQREKEHVEQISQSQKELENILRTLMQREQDVAAQLLAIQQQAIQEQAELAQTHNVQVFTLQHEHAGREQVLIQQLQTAQLELQRLEREWSQREKEHVEQTSQIQKELENMQRTLVQREQDVAAQLFAIQQQAAQQLQTKQEELRSLEVQLKNELEAEQLTSLRLNQSLIQVQQSLKTTHASFSWRMTAPLRSLASVMVPKNNTESAISCAEELPSILMPQISESQPVNPPHPTIDAIMPIPVQAAVTDITSLDELLSLHDQQFVNGAYKIVLGREPDPEGLRYYSSRLRSGYAKIQILAQLSLCKEAKAHAKTNKKAGLASLSGLRKAIKNYRRGQYLLIGGLYRWINGVESNHPGERKLRAIEQQIFLLSDESKYRFNQLEATLSDLQHLVVQQNSALQDFLVQQDKSINAALGNMSVVISDRLSIPPVQLPETTPPLPSQSVEPEGLKQLSRNAKDIYFQLKSASANNARRAV